MMKSVTIKIEPSSFEVDSFPVDEEISSQDIVKTEIGIESAEQANRIVSESSLSSPSFPQSEYTDTSVSTLEWKPSITVLPNQSIHNLQDFIQCTIPVLSLPITTNSIESAIKPEVENFIEKKLPEKITKIKQMTCPDCNEIFSIGRFYAHRQRFHRPNVSYNCHKCGRSFKLKTELKYHLKHHFSGPSVCTVCNRQFKKPHGLKLHMKSHTKPGTKYQCDICFKTCVGKYQMSLHKKMHTKVKSPGFKCLICGKILFKRYTLHCHIATVHNSPVKCEQNLVSTSKEKHLASIRWKKCPYCPKRYLETSGLRTHLIICSKRPNRQRQLNLERARRIMPLVKLPCENCRESFESQLLLYLHNVTKHGQRAVGRKDRCYVCDECDKIAITKQAMKRHIFSLHFHLKNSSGFHCPFCSRSFSYRHWYVKHLIVCKETKKWGLVKVFKPRVIKLKPKVFKCLCGREFCYKKRYNAHVLYYCNTQKIINGLEYVESNKIY